jgi:hypothetical protein
MIALPIIMALAATILLVLVLDFAKQYKEQAALTRIENRLRRYLGPDVIIVRLPGSIVAYRQGFAGVATIRADQEVQALAIASAALGSALPLYQIKRSK